VTVVDGAVAELTQGERAWSALTLSGRRQLLEELRDLTVEHAEEWVRIAGRIKRLAPDSPLVGEEWITGPYPVVSSAAALAATLAALEQGRSPADGFHVTQAPGNRSGVQVLPHTLFDRLLLNGYNALLLDDTERTVVRGPFRPLPRSVVNGEFSISPKPPWFTSNRTAAMTGRLLTYFAARPSWRKLPAIFASALRG
jgi:hypothetical protein